MTSMKAAPRRRSRCSGTQWAWAYALIAPTIVGLCVLNIYPFFYSIC